MREEELLQILDDWSFWKQKPKKGLKRDIVLPSAIQNDIAFVIQGVRRCGKSTLLTQLPDHYDLDLKNCYFCNFEDPRLLENLTPHLLSQIVELARKRTANKALCYFFFDEIQNVDNWEKWVHTQLERPKNNHFVLTGSNSCLLSGEFGSALTGRHITLELFPFSYDEYKLLFPKKNLENYFKDGGFPRSLTYEQPYQLLQEYFNDIITRDVFKRVNARNVDAVKQVVKMAFETCGSELSYRKIAAVTGLTVDTVKSYLEACEQSYLLFSCPYFAYSEKKRSIRQKKYYPIDTALRLAVTNSPRNDYGKNLEILTFLKLKQKYKQVFYWHEVGKGEVDFIVQDGMTLTPYQVSWNGSEPRHEQSLKSFYETFPHAQEAVFIDQKNIIEAL